MFMRIKTSDGEIYSVHESIDDLMTKYNLDGLTREEAVKQVKMMVEIFDQGFGSMTKVTMLVDGRERKFNPAHILWLEFEAEVDDQPDPEAERGPLLRATHRQRTTGRMVY